MSRGAGRRASPARLFEGTGLYSAAGLFLVVIGVTLLLVTLFSQVGLLWTGQAVSGTEQGGIVYYRDHGVSYSMSDPGSLRTRARVTVYVDGSDPSRAELDSTTARVSSGVFGVGPLAAGVAFLAVGLVKKRRNRRRRDAAVLRGETFGQGLDPETVHRLLQQRRARDRPNPYGRPG